MNQVTVETEICLKWGRLKKRLPLKHLCHTAIIQLKEV